MMILFSAPFPRISPETSKDQGEADKTSSRRGKSAPGMEMSRHIKSKVQADGGVCSPPDPLEPWSTKDIKSINKILDTSDKE
jgi:hypothetical protein